MILFITMCLFSLILGYLTWPSPDIINVSKIFEGVFLKGFSKEKRIIKKLFTLVNNTIPKNYIFNEVIECQLNSGFWAWKKY